MGLDGNDAHMSTSGRDDREPDLVRPPDYPQHWEADVVLRDGTLAQVRPIVPDDAPAVHRMHDAQSEESIYLRFFAPIKHLSPADVHRFTNVDYNERVALVALMGEDLIGIARYDRLDDPSRAEVAFNISDHYQGKGVGSVLLEHLAAIAQEAGISGFVADVLPQNRKMMRVFVDAGYEVTRAFDDGVISVSFTIEPTEKSQSVQLAREHRAEAQSMAAVLRPTSIAVVGASRRPDALGTILLDNILDGGFTGTVHVVTSEADALRGLKAYRRVNDIGEQVDMALICVPAETVLDVVDDCAQVGVRALLVVSSGFAEAGPDGEDRQAELLRRARAYGMRVVGPNSFGLENSDPQVQLQATLSVEAPVTGGLGIFSQSGGLGASLLASVNRRGLGMSCFLSAGNRVDVSGNDFMQYLIDDEKTTCVGLYLETVGNPRKFSRIARQLSLRKPVVCVKSPTGGVVPPGHRARTTNLPVAAFEALLEQAGAIPAQNIHDMVNICQVLAQQPLPAGNRVALVSNSPGLASILADEAHRRGLSLGRTNPTLALQCTVGQVSELTEASLADDDVDAVIIALVPPTKDSEEVIAASIAHAAGAHTKPVVATFIGMRDTAATMRRCAGPKNAAANRVVPTYKAPMEAVRALGAAAGYARWLASDRGERVHPHGIDRTGAARIVEQALTSEPTGRPLDPDETAGLLAAVGVSVWPAQRVANAHEAVQAAEQMGYPVVLRSMRTSRLNPGGGAVRVGLSDEAGVRRAYASLADDFGPQADIAVQHRAERGVPMTIASTEDPVFGPVLTLGLSGVPSDLLGDIVHSIPPLSDVDIAAMIRALKCAPLLDGTLGPSIDRAALADVVARVSVLADLIPEIARLELDPVNARPGGIDVLGARIVLAPADARTDAGRRALT